MIKYSNKVNEISLEIIKKKTNVKYLSKSIINLKKITKLVIFIRPNKKSFNRIIK